MASSTSYTIDLVSDDEMTYANPRAIDNSERYALSPRSYFANNTDHRSEDHSQIPHTSISQEIRMKWLGKIPHVDRAKFITPEEWGDYVQLKHHQLSDSDITLKPGMDVEMQGDFFFRVFEIGMNRATHAVLLRGLVFLRNGQSWTRATRQILAYDDEDMSAYLTEAANELHASLNVLADTPFHFVEQALRIFPVHLVKRCRQIQVTNRIFPSGNPSFDDGGHPGVEQEHDLLFCRWITTKVWSSDQSRRSSTTSHCYRRVSRVSKSEMVPPDIQYAELDEPALLHSFRGETRKGGSSWGIHDRELKRRRYEKRLEYCAMIQRREEQANRHPRQEKFAGSPIILEDTYEIDDATKYLVINDEQGEIAETDEMWEQTMEEASSRQYPHLQRYSFADIFCGCGGASVAAVSTGWEVQYGVDFEEDMCRTYQLNHPAARLAWTDAHTFVSRYNYDMKVDVLHLSFPCQPYSKAHTTPGRNDEANKHALSILESYIDRARPRIVTIEEADGLATYEKHRQELQRIIYQLTTMNYSVEFKVVAFADYGICQRRCRLIVIASCPGQRLPGFPPATHIDPGQRLRKFQSHPEIWSISDLPAWIGVREAIADLPSIWIQHDPRQPRLFVDGGQELCPNRLAPTLMTNNAGSIHYEGWRKYTIMEKLLIQGFPLHFQFPDRQRQGRMEKQIGNAVPPKAFEAILKHIQRELLSDDGKLDELDPGTGERTAVTQALYGRWGGTWA